MNPQYKKALIGPFKTKTVKVFFFIELVLVVSGYLISFMGENPESYLGHNVDLHKALAGLYGAMAIAFFGFFIMFYIANFLVNIWTWAGTAEKFNQDN